jgi:hypothetical protein
MTLMLSVVGKSPCPKTTIKLSTKTTQLTTFYHQKNHTISSPRQKKQPGKPRPTQLFDVPAGTFTGEKDSRGREKFIPTWNWRSTTAANKIYLEIFTWPTATFHLDKLPRKVTSAYLLADKAHKPLKITPSGEGLDIQLPAQPLDPIATVVVLNTTN